MTAIGLLGVPSSAAAHWPGQEKAPRALRDVGLPDRLRDAGLDVVDHGDRPVVRWQAHPTERRPHNVSRVLDVLRDTREHVGGIIDARQVPLVIGGDCTVTLAVVGAAVDHDPDVALLYFDGGPDLRTPVDNPSGVMDSMGVAHLLDLPSAAPRVAGCGPRRPLLAPEQIYFFGVAVPPGDDPEADHEHRLLDSLPSRVLRAAEVTADPVVSARRAADTLASVAGRFIVHFDVDVLDFYDLPVADVPIHNDGLTLDTAVAALAELVARPDFAGLTVTEFNPDHGEPDGSTTQALATALVTALAPLSTR
jgi:arginase